MASNATGFMLGLYLRYISDNLYHISASEVGFFAVSFYISELALAPVFGALSDRYGRKTFIALGSVFGLIAVTMTGLTSSLFLLLITRLLEGLSTATSAPAVLGIISADTASDERRRGRVVALFEVATVIGIAGGVAIGGPLWQWAHTTGFFIVAGIYAVSLLLFMLIRENKQERRQVPASVKRHLEILSNPRVLRFAPAWLAINAIIGIWFSHGAFQFSGRHTGTNQFLAGGFSGGSISLFFAGFGLSFLIGTLVWGQFYSRMTRPSMMLIALSGVFIAVLDLFIINHFGHLGDAVLYPAIAVLLLTVFVESGFTPAALGYLAEIAEEHAEDRGTIMGFYSIFLGGGQLVGSLLGGPFADIWSVDGLILLTLLVGLVALVTVLFLRSSVQRDVQRPSLLPTAAD